VRHVKVRCHWSFREVACGHFPQRCCVPESREPVHSDGLFVVPGLNRPFHHTLIGGDMTRRLLALALILAATLIASTPAHATPGAQLPARALQVGCDSDVMCLWDYCGVGCSGTPLGTYPSWLPRNTCYDQVGGTSVVQNNTFYRWYLFRTTTCGGSHLEVPPHSVVCDTCWPPDWDNATHGVMRTSSRT
jgi:hypothetical protein